MAIHFERCLLLGKQKLSEVVKRFLNSEVGRELHLLWVAKTNFVHLEENMLKSINNPAYDFISNDLNSVSELTFPKTGNPKVDLPENNLVKINNVNDLLNIKSDSYMNNYNKLMLVKTIQDKCQNEKNPFNLFKDEMLNKENMMHFQFSSLCNFITQHLITYTIQKKNYIKKASITTYPNLIQEMQNIHLPLKSNILKINSVLYDAQNNNRKMTTSYVNLQQLKTIVKDVVKNLLEFPRISTKSISTYFPTEEPSQLLLTILKTRSKIKYCEDEEHDHFDKLFLSSLNSTCMLYLLQQLQEQKLANVFISKESSKNGTNNLYVNVLSKKFTLDTGNVNQICKTITNLVEVENIFCNTLFTKKPLINYSIIHIFSDISHVIESLLGIPHVNCSRIDYDDVIQRKQILDINRRAFDNLEKQLKDIKIIDKVEENAEDELEDDDEIRFQNFELRLHNGYCMTEVDNNLISAFTVTSTLPSLNSVPLISKAHALITKLGQSNIPFPTLILNAMKETYLGKHYLNNEFSYYYLKKKHKILSNKNIFTTFRPRTLLNKNIHKSISKKHKFKIENSNSGKNVACLVLNVPNSV